MAARTAQNARMLVAAVEALRGEFELRHRNVIEARRHLSSLSAERRAQLEAEWEAPVSDGRRTGPEAF